MSKIINMFPGGGVHAHWGGSATPDEILKECEGKYSEVFVLGWEKEEGFLVGRGSDTLNVKELLYMLEMFKASLVNGCYEE